MYYKIGREVISEKFLQEEMFPWESTKIETGSSVDGSFATPLTYLVTGKEYVASHSDATPCEVGEETGTEFAIRRWMKTYKRRDSA